MRCTTTASSCRDRRCSCRSPCRPTSPGSKIFGEYGDPWDLAVGVNWFPLKRRELRVNVQGLYLEDSPVGYASVPFIVGGNGWVFTTDVMLNF